MSQATTDRIVKQRVKLLMDEPFFGLIGLRLKIQEVAHGVLSSNTIATNGRDLLYYEGYVAKLNDAQLKGLLVHEILHVTNKHMFRRGARNPKIFNYACDAVIDHMAKDAGYDVPDSFADQKYWDYAKGLSAEAVYDRIMQDAVKVNWIKGQGGRAGEVLDSELEGAAQTEEEAEIEIAVRQAAVAQALKKRGNLPAWMKSMIDDVCKPKVSWKELLANLVADVFRNQQSWATCSRKHIHSGLYLPGWDKEGLGEVIIFNDTSGSTWSDRPQFFAEIKTILEDHQPELLHIIDCDSRVGKFITLEPGDYLIPEMVGGGGSDFRPSFEEVEKRKLMPAIAIVLSDMDIAFPEAAPPYPVIGISTTKLKGPSWMTTVHMYP